MKIVSGTVNFDCNFRCEELVYSDSTKVYIENGILEISNGGDFYCGVTPSNSSTVFNIVSGALEFTDIRNVIFKSKCISIDNTAISTTKNQRVNGLAVSNGMSAQFGGVTCNTGAISLKASDNITLAFPIVMVDADADIAATAITIGDTFTLSKGSRASFLVEAITGWTEQNTSGTMRFEIYDTSTVLLHSDSGCPIDFTGDNKPAQGFINFISNGYAGGSFTISGMNHTRLQALQNGGFVAIDGKPLDANEFLAYVDCTLEPNVTISIKQMPSKVPAISGPYPLPLNQFPQISSLAVFPNQGYYIPNGQALEGSSTNFAIAVVKNFQPGPTPKVIEFPVTDNNAIGVMCGNPELSVSFNGSFPKNLSQDYKGQITYSTLFNQGFSSPTPINGLPYQYKTYYFDAQYDAFNDTVFFAGRQGDREGLIFSLVNAGQKEFITTITMPDNTNWNVEDSSFGVSSNPRRIYFCGENAVTYCDIDKGNLIGSVSVPKVDGKQATALTYICVDNANGVVYVSALYGEGGQQETVIHKFSAVTNDYIGIVIRQQGLFSNMLVDDTGTYLYSAGGLRINVIETNGSFVANTIMLDKQADGEEIAAMGWDRLSLTLVVGISDYSSAGTPTPSRVYMINKPYNAA
ncbi:hypothetical protein IR196_12735 [Brucella anthropi]|uniref:hypothetical protein n=1 Tax=Brucella anthropi TaxID=529 RepID=UPI00188A17DF|nr:hypothetical protein [Brucella anthropi]QPA29085.1 hypothetical protein IR196_12735 [Brucella anthropi]